MQVEFYYSKKGIFTQQDHLIVNNKWTPYDELSAKDAETIHLLVTQDLMIANYSLLLMKRGIIDTKERLKLIGRRFFPLLNNIPDIDENGKLNFECYA